MGFKPGDWTGVCSCMGTFQISHRLLMSAVVTGHCLAEMRKKCSTKDSRKHEGVHMKCLCQHLKRHAFTYTSPLDPGFAGSIPAGVDGFFRT